MLISLDNLKQSEQRYRSWKQSADLSQPEEAAPEYDIESGLGQTPPPTTAKTPAPTVGQMSPEENMANRMIMLNAVAPEPVDFAYERAIGKNDSVYSNFCELIVQAKQKVGRIVLKKEGRKIGYATGFMVSERLLLTNWHVFQQPEDAADSEVEFYYELDTYGRLRQPVVAFTLETQTFFHSNKDLDYCLVAVAPVDVTGAVPLQSIGYIFLDPTLGKLGNEGQECLNIIHHPAGDYKQLSIRENQFTKIMPTTLWYKSDTAQGSSGSPVFNDQWQPVALHHLGVAKKSDDGTKYLDKDDNVIPEVDGKVDVSRIYWIANEGIRISIILKDVFQAYPADPHVAGLKINPDADPKKAPAAISDKPFSKPQEKSDTPMNTDTNDNTGGTNDVRISFPASLLDANGRVTVSITNKPSGEQISTAGPSAAGTGTDGTDEAFTEAQRLSREAAMDFSDCKGYQSQFLGTSIPMPQPKKSIQKFVARLTGSTGIVLKYYYYSVILNAVRKMPIISAINVSGDPAKRLDTSKRKDDWLRDNRLDFNVQLNDKYYSNSGFDKGHMSRREDANWGDTGQQAKLAADTTCMYTNACPQVHALNGAGGLWGKLEKAVLEKGAELESGGTSKITVFNGPIFADDDPVYKGVQVPMQFYKIILWKNNAGTLKATAFKLSQTGLTDNIDFEAIDIDSNVAFQEYQCSIKSLEKATGIDFSGIAKYDTFDPAANPNESLKLESEAQLSEMLDAHDGD